MTPYEYRTAISSAMLRDSILCAKGYPRPIALPAPREPAVIKARKTALPCDRIAEIQITVADFYGITRAQLIGHSHRRALTGPRQLAIYIANRITGKSVAAIARAFGGRDHTTALHAIEVVAKRIQTNDDLRADYEALLDMLCPMDVAA